MITVSRISFTYFDSTIFCFDAFSLYL